MRIVLTGSDPDELAARLAQLGHEVVVAPLIEIEPTGDGPIELEPYDWVVVTSRNGARELLRRGHGRPHRIAAIGPGTAGVLVAGGLEPDLVPRVSTQEGLVAELPKPPGRVLFAGAEGARRVLVEALGAEFLPLYRTLPSRASVAPAGDLVVLASASAAGVFGGLGIDIPAVSIGPQTTKAARAAGARVVAEAVTHDVDGLVAAIDEATR